ncbi:MAG: pyridoxal phosphate-dependent aminotransferase [Rhizobiaceae bacterium]
MIRPLPHLEAMEPYALADLGDSKTVSLAQNESDFPPSPLAIAAGRVALDHSQLYPDPDWTQLCEAIGELHDLSEGTILCGAGSMELIGCLIRAYAGPGDTVVGTQYGYAFVATACAQVGSAYLRAAESNLTVSVDAILKTLTADTRIVFLCNPGNPTGTAIPNAEIIRLRRAMPNDVLLIIDQAYAEFCDDVQMPREVFALTEQGNTVIVRTFSKAYALAGARAGWGYFPPIIAQELRKLLNPNNISIVSQAMATAAMLDQLHMKEIVQKTARIRNEFAQSARGLGINIPDSHTNFVLLQFDSAETAKCIDKALRDNELLLRGMGGYGLPDCLRATICARPIMHRVLHVLKEAMR